MDNTQETYTENQQLMKELMEISEDKTPCGNLIRFLWKNNRDETANHINSLWTDIPYRLRMEYTTKEMPDFVVQYILLMLYCSSLNPHYLQDREKKFRAEFFEDDKCIDGQIKYGWRNGLKKLMRDSVEGLTYKDNHPIVGNDIKRKEVAKDFSNIH